MRDDVGVAIICRIHKLQPFFSSRLRWSIHCVTWWWSKTPRCPIRICGRPCFLRRWTVIGAIPSRLASSSVETKRLSRSVRLRSSLENSSRIAIRRAAPAISTSSSTASFTRDPAQRSRVIISSSSLSFMGGWSGVTSLAERGTPPPKWR